MDERVVQLAAKAGLSIDHQGSVRGHASALEMFAMLVASDERLALLAADGLADPVHPVPNDEWATALARAVQAARWLHARDSEEQ